LQVCDERRMDCLQDIELILAMTIIGLD
jgi:hypothetical protein